jgi:hypothetical protein
MLGNGGDRRERTILFTAGSSGIADLQVLASGIESSAALKIVSADAGELRPHAIRISLNEGERTKLSVTFDEPYDGPIDLVATALVAESVS